MNFTILFLTSNCQNINLDSLPAKWTFNWEVKISFLPQLICHKCKTSSWSQRKEGDRQNLCKSSLFLLDIREGENGRSGLTVTDPKYNLSSKIFPAFACSYHFSLSLAYINRTSTFPIQPHHLGDRLKETIFVFILRPGIEVG